MNEKNDEIFFEKMKMEKSSFLKIRTLRLIIHPLTEIKAQSSLLSFTSLFLKFILNFILDELSTNQRERHLGEVHCSLKEGIKSWSCDRGFKPRNSWIPRDCATVQGTERPRHVPMLHDYL